MRIHQWAHVFILSAVFGALCCNDDRDSPLYGSCKRFCQWLAADDEGWPGCREDCIAVLDDAKEISDACGDAYSKLIICVDELDAGNAEQWQKSRGTEFDYPCKPETVTFTEVCPGLWFTAPDYLGPETFW